MKRLIVLFSALIVALTSCSSEKQDLYEKADYFVNSLYTDYESYSILGGADHTEYTKNRYYKITPVGRLINVRIEKDTDSKEYEKLKTDLTRHFKNNPRVNKVYICKAGTVMIDCRN
jgi:hypothetical protein|nr:MAG TPA: protein of unknown function (DUF4971) [Caudoviricetes sp.]